MSNSTPVRTFGLYWRLTRGFRKGFLLGILAFVGSGILGLLPPKVFGLLVDSVTGASSTWTPGLCAALFVGASVAQSILRYPQRLCFTRSAMGAVSSLRIEYGDRLLASSHRMIGCQSTGELVSRATTDLQAIEAALGTGLAFLIGSLLHILSVPLAMVSISSPLSVLALVILCPIPFLVHRRIKRIVAGSEAAQASLGSLSARVQENGSALQTIRGFRLEEWQNTRFESASNDYAKQVLASSRSEAGLATGVQILVSLGTFAIFLAGGRETLEGSLTIGDFVAFSQYAGMLVWPLMGSSWAAVLFTKGEVSLRRLYEVIDHQPPGFGDGRSRRSLQGRLEVRSLTFSHPGAQKPTLSACSFTVNPGERIAILGATGSGKSTLMELLVGGIEPPVGAIFLDGHDVRTLCEADLRRTFTVVPQEPFLFSGTISTNLVLGGGEDPVANQELQSAVEAARLEVGVLPQGLETPVLTRGANLSGGQRQRAALARALIRSAPILVLDDATSGLDAQTEEEVLGALEKRVPKQTLILVTQRTRSARTANRIIVLEGGRVAESGTHEELMKANGFYAAYAARQDPLHAFDES